MSIAAQPHPDQVASLTLIEGRIATVGGAEGAAGAMKRCLDVVIVVAALPIVLPVMAILAIVVKLSSRGPVLFRQVRVGRGGRTFKVWKFRTMHVDAHERLRADPSLYARYLAHDFKLPPDEDPRIIGIGRFLRASSLDEFPQLFQVLSGKMSLVGPRPIVPEELAHYGQHVAAYLDMRPGLTGRWQCDGRSTVRYPERAELDAEYYENWSLAADLGILLRTIPAVFRRHGAH